MAAAAEMERSVLAAASIDPDVLRQELQAVVRELASQFASPASPCPRGRRTAGLRVTRLSENKHGITPAGNAAVVPPFLSVPS